MNVGKVYALCLRLILNPIIAEKLTVEIFITTWQKISVIREDTSFASWLTGITIFTILEWIRNNKGKTDEDGGLISKKFSISGDATAGNTEASFENNISYLPDKARIVFILHDVEKYSGEEIADLLSISTNDVATELQTAYKRLESSNSRTGNKISIIEQIKSLPDTIQPENDLWKSVFAELRKLQNSEIKKAEKTKEEANKLIEKEKKRSLFNFLNRKKNRN